MLNFKFPDVGEGIPEGTIVKWHVREGDKIETDQVMAEVETDKAIVEIPSPRAGTVLKLYAKEGDVIEVGSSMIAIGEKGEVLESNGDMSSSGSGKAGAPQSPAAKSQSSTDPSKDAKPKSMHVHEAESPKSAEAEKDDAAGVVGELEVGDEIIKAPTPMESGSVSATSSANKSGVDTSTSASDPEAPQSKPSQAPQALPRTRILAEQLGVDLDVVTGTGRNGLITDEDVKKTAGIGSGAAIPDTTGKPYGGATTSFETPQRIFDYEALGETERTPYQGVRRTIGDRMKESVYTAPHVSIMDTASVDALWDLRKKEKEAAEKKGIKLTFLPFVIKAAIEMLKNFPTLNASLDEQKSEIVLKKYYNIGVAVDTDQGLMVPVIKKADQKSILDLAKELSELAEKARTRKIDLKDLSGSTFSISNYGSCGAQFATPVINYPDAAILGIGRIKDTPIVTKEGQVSVGKTMGITLTFDHRILDGALAAKALGSLMECLNDPEKLLS